MKGGKEEREALISRVRIVGATKLNQKENWQKIEGKWLIGGGGGNYSPLLIRSL